MNTLDSVFHQRRYGTDTPWRDHPCGSGSTMQNTQHLRDQLPPLFSELGIQSLLDAACGDASWISTVEWDIDYTGMDCVTQLIENNRIKYPYLKFVLGDICADTLPQCDAVFAKDVLIHLPERMVKQFLHNVTQSGSKYLIASTYPNCTNSDIALGDFRPVNLQAEPYCLPEPQYIIEDITHEPQGTQHRQIAVWQLKDRYE